MSGPPIFALIAALTDGYRASFVAFGALTFGCGLRILLRRAKVSANVYFPARMSHTIGPRKPNAAPGQQAAEVHPMDNIPDPDPQETQEWLAALDGVLAAEGLTARISSSRR
jgi:hypothetical protein